MSKVGRITRRQGASRKSEAVIPSDVGRPITNWKPNTDVPDLEELLTEANRNGKGIERDVQDYQGRWYSLRIRPRKVAASGTEAVLTAPLVDNDSAKRASAAVVESIRYPLFVLDSQFRVITANPAFYQTFGLKSEKAEGKILFELANGDWNIPRLRKLFTHALQQEEVKAFELPGRFRGAGQRTLSLTIRRLRREQHDQPLLLVIIEDLTERRKAELQLRRNEEWMRSSFEDSIIGMTVISLAGKFVRVNPAYCRFTGYSEAELRRMHVADVAFPEDKAEAEKWFHKVLDQKTIQFERRFRHKAGGERWGLVNSAVVRGPERTPVYINGQVVDITERRSFQTTLERREQDLRESEQKLRSLASQLISQREEITRMVAREAHDVFAQSLVSTGMSLSELERTAGSAPAKSKRRLRTAVREIQTLAQDIHEFARRIHPAALEELGLEAALRGECVAFSKQHGIRVRFSTQGTPKGLTKESQLALYRIAQESLRNIVKHSKTKSADVNLIAAGREVLLQVRDGGMGFDPAAGGKGGLGLLSMEERARMVGGLFRVESIRQKYTLVEARVPVSPAGGR
jgi:PAS domain S-box-containing protein